MNVYYLYDRNSNCTPIVLTRAFCLGEDRQHMTEAQLMASSKKDLSKFLLRE